MGTIIIAFLIIIDYFKLGYMRPYTETTWTTSITVKRNIGIGEVIFTVPNGANGKHQTYIQMCNTSNYFEMVHKRNCQVFRKITGVNYGFPYTLKVTCLDRSNLKIFYWLSYKSFYIRIRFISNHITNVALEDVAPTIYLKTAASIPDSDLRQFPNKSTNVILKLASKGNNTSNDPLPKRMKRCTIPGANRRKKRCGGGGGSRGGPDSENPVTVSASTTQMSTVTSQTTTTASTKAASTQSMSSGTKQATTPTNTTKTNTPPTIMTQKHTVQMTKPTTIGTTLPTALMTTANQLTTSSIIEMTTRTSTPQTTTSTTPVSSTTLKTTHITPFAITSSTTRTSPATNLSTLIKSSSTGLTTITSTTPSITPSTTISKQSTILSTKHLTISSTSGITQSNVPTSTTTYPKMTSGFIPLTAPITTKMTTATKSTRCTDCISTPLSTSLTNSSQYSLGTVSVMATASQQTRTATCKSSNASKITTISTTPDTYVSSSMEEITTVYEISTTTNAKLQASSKMITRGANTVTANTTIRSSTAPLGTTKTITSMLDPRIVLVTSTSRVLTTTDPQAAATLQSEATVVSMDITKATRNVEQASSSAFVDDPLNVVLVSTLAGLTAIGSIIVILSCIRLKILETENTRSNSIVAESTSTSSSASSIPGYSGRCSVSSLPSNGLFSSKASKSPLLTPVETV